MQKKNLDKKVSFGITDDNANRIHLFGGNAKDTVKDIRLCELESYISMFMGKLDRRKYLCMFTCIRNKIMI